MPISAEVIRIKDHNEDHEVGGLDLPVTVTLETSREHTLMVVDMITASLGKFARIGASRIRVLSSGMIEFSTFDVLTVGDHFTWSDSVWMEKMLNLAHARIENVIERNVHLALMEFMTFRTGHVGSFRSEAALPPIKDKKGAVLKIGDWCRFSLPASGRTGIGWISQLGCHPIRPLGVRPLDERLIGGLGASPAEIEVIPDFRR
jgi:hypothetical protein